MGSPNAVLIGTLDTKSGEHAFLGDRLRGAGVAPLVVDVGTKGPPRTEPDVAREEVAAAGGIDLAALPTGTRPSPRCAPCRSACRSRSSRRWRRGLAGLRETLPPAVEVLEVDAHINDEAVAVATAARLDEFLSGKDHA